MKLVKRITIDIYDTGFSESHEKEFIVLENKIDTIKGEAREITTTIVKPSFKKYNIILFSKKSRLYSSLEGLRGKKINLIFMGESFEATVDKSIARLQGLKPLYEYANMNNINFQDNTLIELSFNKFDNTITINQIKE